MLSVIMPGALLTTGGSNVLFGGGAGGGLTTGGQNTLVGLNAGLSLVSGGQNTLIGLDCLYQTTGSVNVGLGYYTGIQITTGSGNTIIGSGLNSTGNVSNTLILGANGTELIVADATTVRPQVPTKLPNYTVAGLPSASTTGAGTQAWVTDSTLAFNGSNLGTTVTGGGSNGTRVVSNGTNWLIG